ncbi:MAG: hypothetical protein IKQ83_00800 [Lachnospiraceae bacterium]|nr:hypothetical protein [Lachnospiraceae bacterium]
MDNNVDIDEIVNMIDSKLGGGVGRLKVTVSDDEPEGTVSQTYHHGRCDVGSPWAKGTAPNSDNIDGCR